MSITRRIFLRNSALAVVGHGGGAELSDPRRFWRGRAREPQQATGRHFPARRSRWIEHRCAARRIAVLRDAAQHQYSAQVGDRSRWILRTASFARGISAALAAATSWPLFTPPGRPTPRAPTSTRRISWKPARPGVKITEDGWLNRSLHSLPAMPKNSPFRAIALGPSVPRILSGSEPAVAMNNINDFSVGGRNPKASPAATAFEAMYDHSSDTVLHGTGEETFDAVKMLKSADPGNTRPRRRGLSQGTLRRQPAAARAADQSQSRCAGCLCRYRRMGPSRQRRLDRRPARQCAARLLAIARGILDRSRRSWGRYSGRDDVGVWPHGARKRQPRHRSRPRQRDVRPGRSGEGRQSLRPLAGPRSVATLRRPRSGADHRLPAGYRRGRDRATWATRI